MTVNSQFDTELERCEQQNLPSDNQQWTDDPNFQEMKLGVSPNVIGDSPEPEITTKNGMTTWLLQSMMVILGLTILCTGKRVVCR